MERINGKDMVRSRYAKLQPITDRINGLQDPFYHCNGHENEFSRSNLSVNSYTLQLRCDFQNLLQEKSRVSRMTEKSMREEFFQTKMPAALLKQRVSSLEISPTELLKKQKNRKHRNKEKPFFSLLLNLKVELLDILNCIFYVLWCPIYYFGKLILTIIRSVACLMWSVLTLSIFRGRSVPYDSKELKLVVKEPELLVLPDIMGDSKHLSTDVKKLLPQRSSDFHSISSSVPQGLRTSDEISPTEIADHKSLKDLLSPQKKVNLSLKMIDKMRVGDQIKGSGFQLQNENYYPYSSHHENVSNVGLSSDYLPDKCSGKFCNIQECRKTGVKQYEEPLTSSKDATSKGDENVVEYKRRTHSKNSHLRSEFRLSKNPQIKLSHVKKFEKEKPNEVEPHNSKFRLADYNSLDTVNTGKESLTILLTNLRSKKGKKSRLHSVPVPSISYMLEQRPTTENREECEERVKNNLLGSEILRSNVQQVSEFKGQESNGSKSCLDDKGDRSQTNAAVVPPQVCQDRKLTTQSEHSCIVTHTDDLENRKYATTVSDHITEINELEKQKSKIQSLTLESSDKRMLQSKDIIEGLERLTDPVESSGLLIERKDSLRIAKYTQPITTGLRSGKSQRN
nr:uncharacterized protein LOC124218553 [Neodiprion pinetum]